MGAPHSQIRPGHQQCAAAALTAPAGHTAAVDWWSLGIFLYELLYGATPFRGPRRDVTFSNILNQPLHFPATPRVSAAANDLITRLLHKVRVGGWGVVGYGDS